MSRGFRPPPLAGFYAAADVERSRALAETRREGFTEGRAKGLIEGREAGYAEGAAETRALLEPELEALRDNSAKRDRRVGVADALRQLLTARDADLAQLELGLRDTASVALRTLFPTLLATTAGAEISTLLADALTERAPEALLLRAHPATLATIAAETAAERDSGRLTLEPVPAMAFGSAEVAWTGGGATFDPHALLDRVTAILAAAEPIQPDSALKALP